MDQIKDHRYSPFAWAISRKSQCSRRCVDRAPETCETCETCALRGRYSDRREGVGSNIRPSFPISRESHLRFQGVSDILKSPPSTVRGLGLGPEQYSGRSPPTCTIRIRGVICSLTIALPDELPPPRFLDPFFYSPGPPPPSRGGGYPGPWVAGYRRTVLRGIKQAFTHRRVPGNAGAFRQVRSLAGHASRAWAKSRQWRG